MTHNKFEQLRKKAEALVAKSGLPPAGEQMEMLEVLHELTVNQIELELQNEELRDTQKRLQETKNDYFELYEFAPVGYMNIDQRGIVMSINLTAVKMFNLPRNKLLGRPFSEFIDKGFHDTFFRHLEKTPESSQSVSCELALHKPDNTPLFVRLESIYAGMTIRGERTIRSAIVDMTELNQTRQLLHKLNAELEKRVDERSLLADKRLEQVKQLNMDLILAEQRERQRLAEVLHDDLQQILVGCKFHLSFLRKNCDEAEREEFFDRTEETLIQAIDISRSLSHELYPPALSHSGLAAALNWFSDQITKMHGLNVQMCLNSRTQRFPKEIEIFLYQCARELLLNIVKHGKVDTARLTLDHEGKSLILRTEDKGAGFDSQKLHCEKNGTEGFGLLNIKRRIETMGGTFEVRAACGSGCAVTLSLPCNPVQANEPDANATGLETAEGPPIRITELPSLAAKKKKRGDVKVMLVDDHQILRRGLTQLLESQSDITVIAEAADGRQAVEHAARYKPDVILMDIGLPGMDGVEATAKILEANPNIHIIALTLHEEEWMINRMIEAGARRYLTKNVPAEKLLHAIRSAAAAGAAKSRTIQ